MIKISVIIPVYNRQGIIIDTVSNVLNQTLKDIEVICVDDGSTDDSLKILEEIKKKDSRVSVYHKENGGAGSARNVGIQHAQGEYLFFLDSDDSLASDNVFELLYNKAKEANAVVCGGRLLFQRDDGVHVAEVTDLGCEGFISFQENQQDFYFTRFIYNRKFLKDNSISFPDLVVYEDPVFLVDVMIPAKKFYYLDLDVYLYNKIGRTDEIVDCSNEKMYDWLTGLIYLLKVSSQNQMSILHLHQYILLVSFLCPFIRKKVPNVEYEIINRLIIANASIDTELLQKHIDIDKHYIVPPLKELITLSQKYNKFENIRIVKLLLSVKRSCEKIKNAVFHKNN